MLRARVVHVTPWVPLPPMFGGRETILKLLTKEQANQGLHPIILGRLPSRHREPKLRFIEGVKYVILPAKTVKNIGTLAIGLWDKLALAFDNISMLVHMLSPLLNIIRQGSNNVVIFYGFQFVPLALFTRLSGTPAILGLPVFQSNHHKFSPKYWYRLIMTKCFSAVFTYTKIFWKSYSEIIDNISLFRDFLGHRVHYIPMGVDLNDIQRIQADPYLMELKLKSKRRLVICPRRLVPEKGVQYLIDAIPEVLQNLKVSFIFAGEGPLREFLMKKAQLLGVEDYVIFTGALPHETCLSYIKAADVVVVPSSEEEAFGMVFLEAYALGTPIISTFFGGISNVVKNGYTGMLIEPANSKQLAEAIVTLLNSHKLRSKYIKHGYELVRSQFNISNIVKELTKVLEKYIKKGQAN